MKYYRCSHIVPMWALSIWKRVMCRHGFHCFDEVVSYGIRKKHYLSCDACDFCLVIDDEATTEFNKELEDWEKRNAKDVHETEK